MTQVNWTRQLGLAFGLFALGTTAYWLEFKHKPQKEAADEKSKRVFGISETPVHSVSLLGGAQNVALACADVNAKLCKPGDNSKWELSDPLKLKADDTNANALLSTLKNLDPNETINLKEETPEKRTAMLKEYGLDSTSLKSARQVHVTTSSGTTVLYLGLPHPLGDSLFALKEQVASGKKPYENVDESHVYLIPNFFKSNLEHDLAYWRDKKLVALGAHEVESFKLVGSASSQENLAAEKKDGQWLLHSNTSHEEIPADSDSVDALLSSVTYLTAKTFVSDNKNDAKAKDALKGFSSVLSLTLQKEKGSGKESPAPFTLTLLQKKPAQATGKLYATVSSLDPLFEIDSSSLGRLDKNMKDLRLTKLITSMDRFGAKHLEFEGAPLGTGPLSLVSKDGKWIIQPDQKEASQEKVRDVLEKLSGNRIKVFLSGTKTPTGEKEGLKVKIGDEANASKRQLVFWKQGDKLFARDLDSKRNEVFLVENTVTDALPWNRKFFENSNSKTEAKSDTPKK